MQILQTGFTHVLSWYNRREEMFTELNNNSPKSLRHECGKEVQVNKADEYQEARF